MDRPDRLDIPAAWIGADLAASPERWTRVLSPAEISEIESAANGVLSRDSVIGQISPASFPLPRVSQVLKAIRTELQNGLGFSLITGLPIERYSIEMAATIFCGIGSHLGSARSQNANGHVLGHVIDVGADSNDPGTRIYQTSERQTFHTDSSDCVGLLCLREAMEGGDSLLVSTMTLYNQMMLRRPDLAELLFEPVATDRRGEIPAGQKPYFMIPVLSWHAGHLTGQYQRQYIESAVRFEDVPALTETYVEALDLFDRIAGDPRFHLRMRLRGGDMQFVYNHTNLHDRTGFRDWPDRGRRRHLLRLWLALPGDRPLPPVFAERYGSIKIGDRGGIMTRGTRLNVPMAP